MVPFNYGTLADFEKKVDLSLAGNMMDCGECHVGGGAMQYVPAKTMAGRTPLRNIATSDVNGGGPITPDMYTAFNYFIDTYDVNGNGNKGEALYIDYQQTGVMEMDCLMCHLPGYKYVDRRFALRGGKIDATRAVGAGIVEYDVITDGEGHQTGVDLKNGKAWGQDGYGTTVVYDMNVVTVNVNGELELTGEWMEENVAVKPDGTNCANCHMNEFSVDWKKRGDHWAPDGNYDFAYEVHYNIGCMGCHERRPTDLQDDDFISRGGLPNFATMGPGLLGHDPAKGQAPYSGLYNKNDKAAFKSCESCHLLGGEGGDNYAAPNPDAAHAAAGLMVNVVQSPNAIAGVPAINHIDLMDCSACHSRKINSYDWGNTGNPLIDATGSDHEGRLTDHENEYVYKQDMTDNTSLAWYKGKLLRVSPSATMFWRDKNDTPAMDANMDGRPHGMDALLMTQVAKTNSVMGWGSMTEDNHGVVPAYEFNTRAAKLTTDIEAWTQKTGAIIKASIFHVNFKNQHAVSPANQAFGVNGCSDCHSAAAEFYNGTVNTVGDGVTLQWDNDMVPFTKVNGFTDATDWHPGQMDKMGVRTIPVRVTTTAATVDTTDDGIDNPATAGFTTRPVERSENMYEAVFQGPADFADSYHSTAAISFAGFEKGWNLMVEVQDTADGSVALYNKMVSGDVADVAAMLANWGAGFTSNGANWGFTVAGYDVDGNAETGDADGYEGIIVSAETGYKVRLKGGVSNAGSFQMKSAAYKNTPWTGVDGNQYAGRSEWVAYLNGITADVLPAHAVAAIDASVPDSVELGATVTLAADTSLNTNGTFAYSWTSSDEPGVVFEGDSVSKTFSTLGTATVTLNVVDAYGDLHQVSKQIAVVLPAPPADIVSTQNPSGSLNTVTFNNLPEHTMLYVNWGDRSAAQRVYGGAIPEVVGHTFLENPLYDRGDHYEYRVTAYVYNGRVRVDVMQDVISIPK